jgi:hypothetical protein
MRKRVQDKVQALWKSWARLAHRVGTFQARVLLTILYSVVLLPFGICARLFANTLRTTGPPTEWQDRPQQTVDMLWAQKQ